MGQSLALLVHKKGGRTKCQEETEQALTGGGEGWDEDRAAEEAKAGCVGAGEGQALAAIVFAQAVAQQRPINREFLAFP